MGSEGSQIGAAARTTAQWMDQDADVTRSLVAIGTPGYAAPEQLGESDRRLTTAADVNGLGAILYELLTGQVPCCQSSTLATIKAVLEQPPKPPHQIVRGVDPDGDGFITAGRWAIVLSWPLPTVTRS